MFTEVTTFSVHPDAMDQLIRYFQDSIAEAMAGQRGFAGMLLLTDRQASQAIAVLLWETEADLLAHTGGDGRWLLPATALLDDTARSASYEVSVRVERTAQSLLWMHGI
jgi:antibiotic biosynthesis monooxygenase